MNKRLLLTSYIALSVVTLTACEGLKGVDTLPYDTLAPKSWMLKDEDLQAARLEARKQEMQYTAEWWKKLNDPVLNKLVGDLAKSNLDVAAALARIDQARAMHGIAESGYFPNLNLGGGAARSGSSENSAAGAASSGANFNNYSAKLDSSWELDLFGRNRAKTAAAAADVTAAEESMKGVMVSVIAETVVNYGNLRMYQQRLDLARRTLEAQLKIYELVASQNKNGLASDADLANARAQMENVRAALPALKTNVDVAKNRLTALLGLNPGALDKELGETGAVPSTDIKLALGIPADVLRKRPDVNVAERKYVAESARVGVKRADFFPSLTLGGSIGYEALNSGDLFRQTSNIFGLSSIISWNIFDAGKIRNALEQQKAVKAEAFANYKAAVVGALEDAEDAVSAYANGKIAEQSMEEANKASLRSYDFSQSQFDNGTINMVELMEASKAQMQAEAALVSAKGQSVQNFAKLYKALGGGWENFSPYKKDTEPKQQPATTAKK